MYHLDKTTHHLLTGREVGNHAVAQGAHRTDVVVSLLVHHLGLLAHGNHLAVNAVESDYRWFVHHNLIITDNDGVGRSQVHRNLLNE